MLSKNLTKRDTLAQPATILQQFAVLLLLVALCCCAAWQLGSAEQSYYQQLSMYNQLQSLVPNASVHQQAEQIVHQVRQQQMSFSAATTQLAELNFILAKEHADE